MMMSIELPVSVEDELRSFASKQGRDVRELAKEAVQQYLASAAITDLESSEVAETQAALLSELPSVVGWEDLGA